MKEEEEAEKLRLEEMDEDEYDALSDEQKAEIDKKRLEIRRERRKRWSLYCSPNCRIIMEYLYSCLLFNAFIKVLFCCAI